MSRRTRQPEVHEDEVLGKAYDHVLAKRLLSYLRPYSRLVAFAVLLLLLNSLLQLAGPLITKIAIDKHIAVGDLNGLARLALLYLVVVLAGFSMQYVQFYVMQWVGQRIMFDLRLRIVRHVIQL